MQSLELDATHKKEEEGENVNPMEEKMTEEESKDSSSTQEEEENKLVKLLIHLIFTNS